MEMEGAWHQTERLHAGTGKGDPFAAAIRATRMPMIITDPRQHDNPIVFANDAFVSLTGYDREFVLGRNCRFLQGPETDETSIEKIRSAIKNRTDLNVDVLNYRKDGTTFWNALYVCPVVDEAGALQFYFASQLDVTHRKEAELKVEAARDHFERMFELRTKAFDDAMQDLRSANQKLQEALETQTALLHEVDHRVKNNLQMVSSLVVLQSRTIPDESIKRSLLEMLSRIEALGTVHRRLYQSDDVMTFDVGECVRDLVTDLTGVGARGMIKPIFELDTVFVPAEDGAPIALIVNEVVTNALKHAFPETRAGTVKVKVANGADRLRIEIADDGVGTNVTGISGTSFGTSLIRTLSRQLKAQVAWADNEPGTRVTIDIPVARRVA
jgi:PAS domain S-box-containing protein